MAEDYYYLKSEWEELWTEVTKAEYVRAERAAGFRNTCGRPDEPATSGFSAGSVRGKLSYGRPWSDSEHT